MPSMNPVLRLSLLCVILLLSCSAFEVDDKQGKTKTTTEQPTSTTTTTTTEFCSASNVCLCEGNGDCDINGENCNGNGFYWQAKEGEKILGQGPDGFYPFPFHVDNFHPGPPPSEKMCCDDFLNSDYCKGIDTVCTGSKVLSDRTNMCVDRTCTDPQVLNGDKTSCVDRTCTSPKILSDDLMRCEDLKCTDPQVLSVDKTGCVARTCTSPKILSDDLMRCEDLKCYGTEELSVDKTGCVARTCTLPQVLSDDNMRCDTPPRDCDNDDPCYEYECSQGYACTDQDMNGDDRAWTGYWYEDETTYEAYETREECHAENDCAGTARRRLRAKPVRVD